MLNHAKKVHVLGCGGIGMSAICLLLLKKGILVSGSDLNKTELVLDLLNKGLKFIQETDPISKDIDCIVYSTAIKENHPTIIYARENNIPLIHRADALKQLMEGKKVLLVAGTHGKTTTSSLLCHALMQLGQKPSYALGGLLPSGLPHADMQDGEYFVAEADESDGSFLTYQAEGMIVTNIDQDHMDFWKTKESLEQGFFQFLNACKTKSLCVFCHDDPVLANLGVPGTTYGTSMKSDYRLVFDQAIEEGRECIFVDQNSLIYNCILKLSGHHNALNALGVFALLRKLNFSASSIIQALSSFNGVNRRCEVKGIKRDILWIDDYGHHPREIRATIQGIKEKYKDHTIAVVFQPHRFSRTQDLWHQFHEAFFHEDEIIITDIYGSNEINDHNLHAKSLAETVSLKLKKQAVYVEREKLKDYVWNRQIVVTFGAGDITSLYSEIL